MAAATYEIGQFVGYVDLEPPVDIMPSPDSHYYALQTEGSREMTAQANLVIRHVPFYLPTIFKPARLPAASHARGEDHPDVLHPLFPRVIFISSEVLDAKLDRIKSTPGMASNPFMKIGEHYVRLSPTAMQAIRYIEAGERALYQWNKKKKLADDWLPKIGDEVRFLVNQVMGHLTGRVSEVDERGRITILMEIMKRTVRVRATANQIDPV